MLKERFIAIRPCESTGIFLYMGEMDEYARLVSSLFSNIALGSSPGLFAGRDVLVWVYLVGGGSLLAAYFSWELSESIGGFFLYVRGF